tara:strand:+ start:742 stop:1122 length:381 start_codon:yes stop_codon:yes gene_type:complete
MAVPNTTTFSLNDVRLELGLGATTNLVACIAAASANSYDPDYYSSPATSLLEFRNYAATPTYWTLIPCAGGSTAYTRLKPAAASQRYINPTGAVYYTWSGATLVTATTPSGFNGSIQRLSGQFGCP